MIRGVVTKGWVSVCVFALLAAGPRSSQAVTIHVNTNAGGLNNGTSWANAFTNLQDALNAAAVGDEIWVARGMYVPTARTAPADPRSATFQLRNGVGLYGGFAGTETLRTQRNPTVNVTTLSGDIAGNDADVASPALLLNEPTRVENAYHVVTASQTNTTARLDGFVIRGGRADATCTQGCDVRQSGGGMLNVGGTARIANCVFTRNCAMQGGGAVFNKQGDATFVDCTFHGNAAFSGGAFINDSCDPKIINCRFTANAATAVEGAGGAIFNFVDASPQIANCVFANNVAHSGGAVMNLLFCNPKVTNSSFSGNVAVDRGGAMISRFFSVPTVDNSIFWENEDAGGTDETAQIDRDDFALVTLNFSCVQGGWTGGGGASVIVTNPLFTRLPGVGLDGIVATFDDDFGDLHLQFGSPCIDTGSNGAVPADMADIDGDTNVIESLPLDLDRNARIANNRVDMGAFEFTAGGMLPVVIGRTPAPGAVVNRVAGVQQVTVTFDRPVTAPPGSLRLVGVNSGDITAQGILEGTGTATLTLRFLTPIPDADRYTATATTNVRSVATGAALAAPAVWNFAALIGDCDGNGQVDIFDLGRLRLAIRNSTFDAECDIQQDGAINIFDLGHTRLAIQNAAALP